MQVKLYEYFRDIHPYEDKFIVYYNDIYKHIDTLPCYTQMCLQSLKDAGKIDYDTFMGALI